MSIVDEQQSNGSENKTEDKPKEDQDAAIRVKAEADRPSEPVFDLSALDKTKLCLLGKEHLQEIASVGFCIVDNFRAKAPIPAASADSDPQHSNKKPHEAQTSGNLANKLLAVCQEWKQGGRLQLAGMKGQQGEGWKHKAARNDYHCWLHEDKIDRYPPPLAKALSVLLALQTELNSAVGLGSPKSEIQLACYPGGGARYVRHRDTFPGGPQRKLTLLYYFNPTWTEGDGGELQLFTVKGSKVVSPLW
eukprot:CAMPEP_0175164966 /NCGR_PEP_ID=MMETSP0087-20121206/26758_1 /TAXON_ID=136419 /ORGANISM="Unknown Unknown, Strain D1" /LENGTH=247 /DNA_ID=CAMNT_0016454159 /DNA_START=30 /DNA_END=773 /DNA_ORIENTATION=+